MKYCLKESNAVYPGTCYANAVRCGVQRTVGLLHRSFTQD